MFRMYDVQLRHTETRRGERALGFLWVFSLPHPPLFFFPSIYETVQKEVGPQGRKGNKHLHRCLELRGSIPPGGILVSPCLGGGLLLGSKFTCTSSMGAGLLEI